MVHNPQLSKDLDHVLELGARNMADEIADFYLNHERPDLLFMILAGYAVQQLQEAVTPFGVDLVEALTLKNLES